MFRPFLSIPWESSQQSHIDIMTQQGHCAHRVSHLQRMSAEKHLLMLGAGADTETDLSLWIVSFPLHRKVLDCHQ